MTVEVPSSIASTKEANSTDLESLQSKEDICCKDFIILKHILGTGLPEIARVANVLGNMKARQRC